MNDRRAGTCPMRVDTARLERQYDVLLIGWIECVLSAGHDGNHRGKGIEEWCDEWSVK